MSELRDAKDHPTLDVNSLLLLTEIVLLVPTLLLLVLGRREEKGRGLLLQEITKTAKMLSRQEYFSYVLLGMQTATKSIKGSIKGSRRSPLNRSSLCRRSSTR